MQPRRLVAMVAQRTNERAKLVWKLEPLVTAQKLFYSNQVLGF